MMITELKEPELMSFPSVTLCRGIVNKNNNPDNNLNERDFYKRLKFYTKLGKWISYTKYGGNRL